MRLFLHFFLDNSIQYNEISDLILKSNLRCNLSMERRKKERKTIELFEYVIYWKTCHWNYPYSELNRDHDFIKAKSNRWFDSEISALIVVNLQFHFYPEFALTKFVLIESWFGNTLWKINQKLTFEIFIRQKQKLRLY